MSIISSIVSDLTQYVKRFVGSTAPSTTPDRTGSLHFDTVNKKTYASYGTVNASDWKELGVGGSSVTVDTETPIGNLEPSQAGEIYLDSSTNKNQMYISVGTGVNDWASVKNWLKMNYETSDATLTTIKSIPVTGPFRLEVILFAKNADLSKAYTAKWEAVGDADKLYEGWFGDESVKVATDAFNCTIAVEEIEGVDSVSVKIKGLAATTVTWVILYRFLEMSDFIEGT